MVDYEIDHILNGSNLLVEVEADWTIRAVGAGFDNGFGWSFDGLNPNVVSSVNGQNLNEGLISNSANGTEGGQSSATIIAFDNVFNVMPNQGTQFINTLPGEATQSPVTVSNKVVFTSPQQQATVGLPPYNPFIFVNGDRTKEVHLADKMPTDLANVSDFGTGSDATDVNGNYTYKTANGLPWAIHISESFDYPAEFQPINEAYLNFAIWATSGGASNAERTCVPVANGLVSTGTSPGTVTLDFTVPADYGVHVSHVGMQSGWGPLFITRVWGDD